MWLECNSVIVGPMQLQLQMQAKVVDGP